MDIADIEAGIKAFEKNYKALLGRLATLKDARFAAGGETQEMADEKAAILKELAEVGGLLNFAEVVLKQRGKTR